MLTIAKDIGERARKVNFLFVIAREPIKLHTCEWNNYCVSHLSKGTSDLKQKCTQLLASFLAQIFMLFLVTHFVRSISLRNRFTLNENPEKLPRGWFSASFFAKRSNQLQLQSSLKWRPPVCQGEGATSRGLLPTTQKILVFNLLTQLLSELFSFKVRQFISSAFICTFFP